MRGLSDRVGVCDPILSEEPKKRTPKRQPRLKAVPPAIFASCDVHRITNPGYNRDRVPVVALALRLHVDF